MHKHCFNNVAFLYFVLENCVFYVISKSNTGIAIFEIVLDFERKM